MQFSQRTDRSKSGAFPMPKFNVSESTYRYGIRENLAQVAYQLLQVFLVGLTIGMFRTVVPALAEDEFGVSKGSFMLLTAFVVAFGFVKGTLNFVAGRWSERVGRKKVLIFGWLIAIPIPSLIYFASSWNWIVAATVLLGVNQGLCWSMTQTSKMDITRADERGLTMGLNEFSGYIGVALAGILTSYMALIWGARLGLMIFGSVVISLALILAFFLVKETHEWARTEAQQSLKKPQHQQPSKALGNFPTHPTTAQMFHLMSWKDRRMAAFCQAGMVEKFVDALVWVLPSISASTWTEFKCNWLDSRDIWFCLGKHTTAYWQAVRSYWSNETYRLGNVDLWARCWADADSGWNDLVVCQCRNYWIWYGFIVSQSRGCRCRSITSKLAGFCDWHLPLLA
jgi:hypothetical protein